MAIYNIRVTASDGSGAKIAPIGSSTELIKTGLIDLNNQPIMLSKKLADMDTTIGNKVDNTTMASATANGLMSSSDFTKLQSIEPGAKVLKPATADTLGGVKVGAHLGIDSNGSLVNNGVRGIWTGGSNGSIAVNTGGVEKEVMVKGLGTAAFKAETDFMLSSGGTFLGQVSAAVPAQGAHVGSAIVRNIIFTTTDPQEGTSNANEGALICVYEEAQ